jgi:hypothetical protein
VPWLQEHDDLQAGPDRLCALAVPQLTLRCWAPPARGETTGRELAGTEWLNPRYATWEAVDRLDRVQAAFVGGTFSCLHTSPGDLFCRGDDAFGQLGSGGQPQASPEDPAYLHVWPAQSVALGSWHGCALAARGGLSLGAFVACWGRGDHGQLGGPARDTCTVGGASVPCARSPQAGAKIPGGMAVLGAGDLFTCVTDARGIQCWGANRDGFFGTPGSCPDSLRSAWPTLHGSVAAPRAACTDQPVRVPEVKRFDPQFTVGPRALCFAGDAGERRCLGGVVVPKGAHLTNVVLSPGADASACTLQGGQVLCWGEAYAPPDQTGTLVPIALDSTLPVREVAVLDASTHGTWDASCLARRGCSQGPAPLARCASGVHGRDWSQLLRSHPESLVGQVVQVRGPLAVGPLLAGPRAVPAVLHAAEPNAGGPSNCSLHTHGPVAIVGAPRVLALEGLACDGDQSRQCCGAPAYGQMVVASGVLEVHPGSGGGSQWTLVSPRLCLEGGRGPAHR